MAQYNYTSRCYGTEDVFYFSELISQTSESENGVLLLAIFDMSNQSMHKYYTLKASPIHIENQQYGWPVPTELAS